MHPLRIALIFAVVLICYLSTLKISGNTNVSWIKIFSPIWLPLVIVEIIAIVYVLIRFLSGDLK